MTSDAVEMRDAAARGDASLADLRQAASGCRACDLYRNATQTVFGEGPEDAPLMLVGEQPGDKEDLEGHPFVGPAGRILAEALEIAGIARELESVVSRISPDATSEVLRAPWVASAILDTAKRVNADLIAMGTHGRKGFTRLMLGSAAEYVVRHAECPVVTLHSDAPAAS